MASSVNNIKANSGECKAFWTRVIHSPALFSSLLFWLLSFHFLSLMLVLFVYLLYLFLLHLFVHCLFFLLETGGGWYFLIQISERANKDSGKLHMFREYSYLSSNESCLFKKEFWLPPDWVVNKNCNKAPWLFTNNCYSHFITPGVFPSCSCRWLFPPWAAQQEERVKITLSKYPCHSVI